jgi:hypothetical protein
MNEAASDEVRLFCYLLEWTQWQRANYTIAELQQMRRAIAQMVVPGALLEEELQVKLLIEAHLQTYVLNGTEPAGLEEAAAAWDFLKDDL